jgi:cation:H+ antiporter
MLIRYMWQEVLLFIVGFWILIKGADILIDGASSIARKAGVSEWLIGLTIVGIGTSIPEFAVMLFSNLAAGVPVGLGTIIGSNTANILFILGITAIIFPLQLKQSWVRRDLPWNIVAILAAFVMVVWGSSSESLVISRFEGAILLTLFIIWLLIAIKNGRHETDHETKIARLLTLPLSLAMVLGGILGVVLGGKWVVDSAATIAAKLGLSQAFIGLTIVGIGTSLPELTVTLAAAWKKRVGIAVGNIIGSNIFDFLGILGLVAMIRPIIFLDVMRFDIIITAFAAVLLLGAAWRGRKYVIDRWEGVLFVILYAAYILRIFLREISI